MVYRRVPINQSPHECRTTTTIIPAHDDVQSRKLIMSIRTTQFLERTYGDLGCAPDGDIADAESTSSEILTALSSPLRSSEVENSSEQLSSKCPCCRGL